MKCPICEDNFYTKIEGEKGTIYEGHYLCLGCMTVFSKDGKVIEKG